MHAVTSILPPSSQPIAVIGLGYVGLPLAVAFGSFRPVVGFDIHQQRIAQLQAGHDSTLEVAPDQLQTATQLRFSSDANDLRDCRIFIVTVPTPVDDANHPDLRPLIKASETVGRALKPGDIVIYESTVYPGATEEVCVPVLEQTSGLTYIHSGNEDQADPAQGFYCGYSPERINPGDKVNTLTTVRKITSGSTPAIAQTVDALYASIVTAGTYPASSIRVAEAAKVIENTQRDLNIAFVNELSVLFARLGIDTLEVLEAAGSKWNFLPFRPGLVGGHCIGVDPYYLTYKAQMVGYNPQVILAGRRINDNMGRYAAEHHQADVAPRHGRPALQGGHLGHDVQGKLPRHPQQQSDRHGARVSKLGHAGRGERPRGRCGRGAARIRHFPANHRCRPPRGCAGGGRGAQRLPRPDARTAQILHARHAADSGRYQKPVRPARGGCSRVYGVQALKVTERESSHPLFCVCAYRLKPCQPRRATLPIL